MCLSTFFGPFIPLQLEIDGERGYIYCQIPGEYANVTWQWSLKRKIDKDEEQLQTLHTWRVPWCMCSYRRYDGRVFGGVWRNNCWRLASVTTLITMGEKRRGQGPWQCFLPVLSVIIPPVGMSIARTLTAAHRQACVFQCAGIIRTFITSSCNLNLCDLNCIVDMAFYETGLGMSIVMWVYIYRVV